MTTLTADELLVLERFVREKAQNAKNAGLDPVYIKKLFDLTTKLMNMGVEAR